MGVSLTKSPLLQSPPKIILTIITSWKRILVGMTKKLKYTTLVPKKPKKSYAGDIAYLGNGIVDENILNLGNDNYITIETSSDDELLVLNKSPFFMCPKCGYSRIIKGCDGIMLYPESHLNYKGR